MGTSVNRGLSQVVARVKGSDYEIDSRIGVGYLVGVALDRALMVLRGFLRFPLRSVRPFVARGATIKAAGSLSFGSGTTFGPGSYVDALSTGGVRLGRNVSVGRNTRIECTGSLRHLGAGLLVGDDVGLGTDCFYGSAGGIEIGRDTIVGNSVSFHSENHTITRSDVPIRMQGVSHEGIVVGEGCWIGAKATILDGARIGQGCVIAAAAVVIAGDYPAGGIYGGTPARLLRHRDSSAPHDEAQPDGMIQQGE